MLFFIQCTNLECRLSIISFNYFYCYEYKIRDSFTCVNQFSKYFSHFDRSTLKTYINNLIWTVRNQKSIYINRCQWGLHGERKITLTFGGFQKLLGKQIDYFYLELTVIRLSRENKQAVNYFEVLRERAILVKKLMQLIAIYNNTLSLMRLDLWFAL